MTNQALQTKKHDTVTERIIVYTMIDCTSKQNGIPHEFVVERREARVHTRLLLDRLDVLPPLRGAEPREVRAPQRLKPLERCGGQ